MTYKDIIKQVSKELGITAGLTDKVYKAYWRAIREYISSQPLKNNLSDEEFLKLRPNVNVTALGKFYVTLDMYKEANRKFKEQKEKEDATYKEGETNVHQHSGDSREIQE